MGRKHTHTTLLLLCCRRALRLLSAPVILMMKQLPSDTPETMQQRAFAVCCTRCTCPCLHAWVVFHRLYGYLSCVFMRLSLVCFYGLCFLFFLFIATMSFAGYFLVCSLLSAFPAYLGTFFRFDLVWFRLSCDHGWIRSGSVNVR